MLPQVAAAPTALVVNKRLASALAGTDLDSWLRAHQIDRLTLAGYMTQNCVESTARHARHLGYTVEVLSDATGTVGLATTAGELTAQQVHQAALIVMASGFAAVGSTQDWCQSIAADHPWPTPSLATTVRPAP